MGLLLVLVLLLFGGFLVAVGMAGGKVDPAKRNLPPSRSRAGPATPAREGTPTAVRGVHKTQADRDLARLLAEEEEFLKHIPPYTWWDRLKDDVGEIVAAILTFIVACLLVGWALAALMSSSPD